LIAGAHKWWSLSYAENEEIIDKIIEQNNATSMAINLQDTWRVETSYSAQHNATGYRLMPHLIKGEGFYISVLQKQGNYVYEAIIEPLQEESNTLPYLLGEYKLHTIGEQSIAIARHAAEFVNEYGKQLKIVKKGIMLGKHVKGKLIPGHELVQCVAYNKNYLPNIEVTLNEAQQYLAKQMPLLQADAKGWHTVSYQGQILGLANMIGNRYNNYYPTELRIRNLNLLAK
jgi:NOL1/NOP2/fmu family ribosome biogenesis protein